MTAKKAALTAFIIGAALILAFYLLQSTQRAPQRAGEQASSAAAAEEATKDSGGSESVEATETAGVDRANGFAQPSPDADQAPVRPTPEQYERRQITIPPVPAPDVQDAAAVAGAFLSVYNSRSNESDTSWQDTTKPWLVPDLAAQLPQVPNGALEGKTPAAVRTVTVGGNVEDWGADTPLRWAHHVQVTVDTQDQGSYLLEYRLRSQLTDQGWLINAAPLDTWQKVEG